jgi:hypothetical protein
MLKRAGPGVDAHADAPGRWAAIALHAVHRHAEPAHLRQDGIAGGPAADARDEQGGAPSAARLRATLKGAPPIDLAIGNTSTSASPSTTMRAERFTDRFATRPLDTRPRNRSCWLH